MITVPEVPYLVQGNKMYDAAPLVGLILDVWYARTCLQLFCCYTLTPQGLIDGLYSGDSIAKFYFPTHISPKNVAVGDEGGVGDGGLGVTLRGKGRLA